VAVVDERARRVGLNEAVFRQVNERLEKLNETFAPVTGRNEVVCECGDVSCAQVLELTESEYEDVRSEPNLFIVAPGHAATDIEHVVREGDGYEIVRKKLGVPTRIAEETDPRG
jgi:hypothetical protein